MLNYIWRLFLPRDALHIVVVEMPVRPFVIIINLFARNENIHNNQSIYDCRSPEKLNVHQAGGP